jgi:N-acetylmuramoyl-L-alanine amidase
MPMPLNYKSFYTDIPRDDDPTTKFYGDEAAGCIFVAKNTGRILIAKRSEQVREGGTWGTFGGKINAGETPKEAAVREVEEETGFDGEYKMSLLYVFKDKETNFKYYNYLIVVPFEFTPKLNWESTTTKWTDYGDWPEPLHFGMEDLLKHAGSKIKKVIDTIQKKNDNMFEAIDIPPAIVQPTNSAGTNVVMSSEDLADSLIIAATLWNEAREDGERGMHGVMNVIMNRANGNFKKAKEIALSPEQFSVWNNIKDPLKIANQLSGYRGKDDMYDKAIDIVDKARNGLLSDITGGAQYFFNPKKANPSWASRMVRTKTIGHHQFYKIPRKSKVTQQMKENVGGISLTPKGLEDVDTYLYEIKSEHSYLRYSFNKNTKIFYLRNIGTSENERNKGYARELLGTFFQIIKQHNGALDTGPYTTSGMSYIKHVVERFAKQYGVRLV